LTKRLQQITKRLGEHFAHPQMFCAVHTLSDAAWDSEAPPDFTNLHRPFGWVPPFEREVGAAEFWFCPERIERQTASLNFDELNAYLDIILFTGDTHVIHFFEEPERRIRIAEDELMKRAPGSYDLLNRIQMSILDERE
jgi:hypothetical protein